MRIVHFTDTFQPRLGYQDYFLAREQLRDGHEVTVVTADRYFRFPSYDATVGQLLGPRYVGRGRFLEEGIPVIRIPTRLEIRRKMWLGRLVRTIAELKPDVVHVHNIANFSATRLAYAKESIGGRMLFDDHMAYCVVQKRGPVTRAAQAVQRHVFIRRIVAAGDAFVGITGETAELMAEVYGIPRGRVTVIPLGVDTRMFRPDARMRCDTRRELGIADGEVVFVYTGKIIPDKGPALLVAAALMLARAGHPVRALLVGGAEQQYWQHISTLGTPEELARVVIHRLPVPNAELPRYLNSADVAVWPREETMSMLEGAACGLPIIVKRSDGLRDRLAADNGLTYPEGDVAALARAMQMQLDPALRTAMGGRGRRLAEERFSWKQISDAFVALYRP